MLVKLDHNSLQTGVVARPPGLPATHDPLQRCRSTSILPNPRPTKNQGAQTAVASGYEMPGIPAHRRSEETRRERRVRDRWCEKYQRSFAKPAALRSEIGPRLDRDSSLLSNSHSAGATVLYLCPVGRMSTRHCVPSIHGRNRRNQLHRLMPSLIKPADGATGPLSIWRSAKHLEGQWGIKLQTEGHENTTEDHESTLHLCTDLGVGEQSQCRVLGGCHELCWSILDRVRNPG